MSGKIKVLQSLGSLGMGGTEIFVMNFFRYINKEKFQVDFLIYDDSKMDFYEEVKSAGSCVYVCSSKSKNKYIRLCSETLQVRRLLKKHHYDIIHCHGNSFKEFLRGIIPGSLIKDTYVIAHSHNPGEPKNTWLDNVLRFILKNIISHLVDVGCSCSDIAGRGKYTKKFMKSSRYKIINNAIDTEKYMFNSTVRDEVREKLGIQKNEFVLGHVGRISYEKNHIFLIDIFKEVKKEIKNARLLLIGDGELRNEVEEKVKLLGLESDVIFVGKCSNAAEYYQAMDCFVLPSHFEGFPFVLVEAQVNGLPCVVSDVVSKSVNISGGVHFVSLNDKLNKWVDTVIKYGNSRLSTEQVNTVICNYELKTEVKKLEGIYADVCRK